MLRSTSWSRLSTAITRLVRHEWLQANAKVWLTNIAVYMVWAICMCAAALFFPHPAMQIPPWQLSHWQCVWRTISVVSSSGMEATTFRI